MEKKILAIKANAKQEFVHQYHLVQYTHHIHFQHHENGACLRASEVKPKLDKFIIKYCKRHNYVLTEECFILQPREEKTALNYKIRIYPVSPEKKCLFQINAQRDGFLGNQNRADADKTEAVFYKDGLSLSLIIQNLKLKCEEGSSVRFTTLASLIDHVLPAFFLLNCFGARSSKGYGSYAIRGKQLWDYCRDSQKVIAAQYLREFIDTYYMIEFPREIYKTELPKKAIIISNLMKSGYNMTNKKTKEGQPKDFFKQDYYKGRIFRYFSEAQMGGDKAFIKQKVLTGCKDKNGNSEDYKTYTEFRFVRAMLGLGKEISFSRGSRSGRTAVISDVKVNTIGDEKNNADTQIIRFNNPVHFVPNGQFLLIIPSEIPEVMSNRIFNICEKDDETKHAEIITPELVAFGQQDLGKGKFNLEEFLDMFMDDFNHQTEFCRKKGRYKSPIDQLFYTRNTGQYELTMKKVGGSNG